MCRFICIYVYVCIVRTYIELTSTVMSMGDREKIKPMGNSDLAKRSGIVAIPGVSAGVALRICSEAASFFGYTFRERASSSKTEKTIA